MPWFAIDDGFDTHPKVRKAGNAAAGLFCRLGAHCAKHLTEGLVDGVTARSYGTAAQLRKLVDVGMLHADGHDCPRCAQPEPGGYVLHDFLHYNRSRKQVETARESGRKRQQKGREKQRQQRSASDSSANRSPTESQVNFGSRSNGTQNETQSEGRTAGRGDVSRRYTLEGGTVVPSQPIPSSVPPLEEQEEKTASYAREPDGIPRIGDRPRIPEAARPLVDALTAAGLVVGWDLHPGEWFLIEALIKRCSVPVLVEHALGMRDGARTRVRSGTYFLPGWRALPDVNEQSPPPAPRKASGGHVPFQPPADHSVYENGFPNA